MVTTIKVVKRRDGASIIAAVVIAMILWQMITVISSPIANKLSGISDGGYPATSGFKGDVVHPIVLAVIELLMLELLFWLYGMVHDSIAKK